MDKIDSAAFELREMDELAAMQSPVHSLHPLAKLFITIAYIFITVSFGKYELSGLITLVLYPVFMFQLSGVPMQMCFHKLRFVMPLVCAVGLFNPFFDHSVAMQLGTVTITGGIISMITLMLKGIFCLMASFLLIATTSIDSICSALRKLHVPSMITTLLLLTFRYVSVMIEEVSTMSTAYKLRAPGQKGIHFSAWGSFLGQLLLRSMDRAHELYESMLLRGFNGSFTYADSQKAMSRDYIFTAAALSFFILCRYVNIAELIGSIAVR